MSTALWCHKDLNMVEEGKCGRRWPGERGLKITLVKARLQLPQNSEKWFVQTAVCQTSSKKEPQSTQTLFDKMFIEFCYQYGISLIVLQNPRIQGGGKVAIVNLGIWSPKSTCRSTPDSSMAARRITPPLEPSRSMAKARAVDKRKKLGVRFRCWNHWKER